MIYKIVLQELPQAVTTGFKLLIISSDSQYALVEGKAQPSFNVITAWNDNEYKTILSDQYWKQPCIDCED